MQPDPPPGPCLRAVLASGRCLQSMPRSGAWLLYLAWMGLIWFLSSLEAGTGDGIPRLGFWGNFGHAGVFGLLALWMIAGLPREQGWAQITMRSAALILLGVTLYGLIDETHQLYVPGRHPSGLDVLVDALGAACTLWVAAYAARPDANEAGMRLRLGLGLAACALAAALVTYNASLLGGATPV